MPIGQYRKEKKRITLDTLRIYEAQVVQNCFSIDITFIPISDTAIPM